MASAELIDGRTGSVIPAAMTEERLALHLPDDLRIEDWQSLGRKLCAMEQRVQWWLGDWWAFGDHTYGSRCRAVADGIFGKAYKTLATYASVSRKFEPSRRRENVAFGHHAEVCALPREIAEEVLTAVEQNSWSVRDTRSEVIRRRLYLDEPAVAAQIVQFPTAADTDHTMKRTGRIVLAAFADWFGLGDAYANVLMALYKAGGTKLSWRALAVASSSHQPMTRGATHEAIHSLRDVFEAEAIDRDDDGYWLTEEGVAECRKALRELGKQLLALGVEPANDLSPLRTVGEVAE